MLLKHTKNAVQKNCIATWRKHFKLLFCTVFGIVEALFMVGHQVLYTYIAEISCLWLKPYIKACLITSLYETAGHQGRMISYAWKCDICLAQGLGCTTDDQIVPSWRLWDVELQYVGGMSWIDSIYHLSLIHI